MELCDLWKNNMLVIAEIESISKFTFICKKDLEPDSKLFSLLEKGNMKIFVISDELYKRLFSLTTEQLNKYKNEFDYYDDRTGVMDDLFNQFVFMYYIIEGYESFYFVSDDIYYGTLRIDENGALVFDKNPQYNKDESKKYIEIYKHLYNGYYGTEEAIDIIKKLYPKNKISKQEEYQKNLKK